MTSMTWHPDPDSLENWRTESQVPTFNMSILSILMCASRNLASKFPGDTWFILLEKSVVFFNFSWFLGVPTHGFSAYLHPLNPIGTTFSAGPWGRLWNSTMRENQEAPTEPEHPNEFWIVLVSVVVCLKFWEAEEKGWEIMDFKQF